ncbi:HelD family protein [Corynebacterium anserum]|uniref:AAA family ATPase n=1 Tax=Corynebacterium anserum TaxID=2684406 RepID=A0A7G7YN52_9CORY|nr:AAA family ATPase [Corynebacterium anserum]QNH95922.1 AAA family ATPase [Corynebacterium anserum]
MTDTNSAGTPSGPPDDPNRQDHHEEILQEQKYLDSLLHRVDTARSQLERRLKDVRKEADIDDPQGLMMRDREARDINQRLESYAAAEIGLMFGRIDVEDDEPENPVICPTSITGDIGSSADPSPDGNTADAKGHLEAPLDRRYIGRIGLHDNDATMRTLLMDWRAPMARPFYLATTLHPDGVHARRHIKTRGRRVTDVSDEYLISSPEASRHTTSSVATEDALLDAVNRARSPHMRDIVETIAAEQDAIIRSPHRGVTVVQGAPGTGKTAVALHRAAFLLYTWRDQLEKSGVLVIGPNDRFLAYISQVLPSLGETGVVLATPGTLLPGITAIPESSLLSREVKGSIEMVTILSDAVKTWQTIPSQPITFTVDGVDIALTPRMVSASRTRARRSRRPHNQARPLFIEHALSLLADAMAETIGADPLGGSNLLSASDRAQLRDDLAEEPEIISALDEFWPVLIPEKVLSRLFDSPEEAAAEYDEQTWEGLRWRRTRHQATEEDSSTTPPTWTDADTPLLDELAEMLGIIDDEEAAATERKQWLAKIAEAQEALDILSGSASQDLDDGFAPEILMAYDVIDAETLADRQREKDIRSTAQRASADLRWAFGHVIVDEAQELSPMAWRMIFRRSPNRWMTIVGDPAQTGNPAGVDSWEDVLQPFVDSRWQMHELTVNYRTPKDIADIAAQLLKDIAPEQPAPLALRDSGTGVTYCARSHLLKAVAHAQKRADHGMIGILFAPDSLAAEEVQQLNTLAETPHGAEVVLADTRSAKGLEFDEVILVEPMDIVEASPMGLNDVYVALTRATQGLTVVHNRELPWRV